VEEALVKKFILVGDFKSIALPLDLKTDAVAIISANIKSDSELI
jgi:hypothetical protein